jgi:CheY-like chemotaxis protein
MPPTALDAWSLTAKKGAVEITGKRILCVDAEAATLNLRKLLLESAGHEVLTAGSETEALEILARGAHVDLARSRLRFMISLAAR